MENSAFTSLKPWVHLKMSTCSWLCNVGVTHRPCASYTRQESYTRWTEAMSYRHKRKYKTKQRFKMRFPIILHFLCCQFCGKKYDVYILKVDIFHGVGLKILFLITEYNTAAARIKWSIIILRYRYLVQCTCICERLNMWKCRSILGSYFIAIHTQRSTCYWK